MKKLSPNSNCSILEIPFFLLLNGKKKLNVKELIKYKETRYCYEETQHGNILNIYICNDMLYQSGNHIKYGFNDEKHSRISTKTERISIYKIQRACRNIKIHT